MHRFDAYSSTSYSRGIRWLPSPEVCRMRCCHTDHVTESSINGDLLYADQIGCRNGIGRVVTSVLCTCMNGRAAESAEQSNTARMCTLILFNTLRKMNLWLPIMDGGGGTGKKVLLFVLIVPKFVMNFLENNFQHQVFSNSVTGSCAEGASLGKLFNK